MSEICQQDLTKKKGTPPSQMSRSKTLSLKTTSVHVVSLVPRSQQVYSGGGHFPWAPTLPPSSIAGGHLGWGIAGAKALRSRELQPEAASSVAH